MKIVFTAILLFIVCYGFAQEKAEQERRIDVEDVPEPALEWFEDTYEDAKKVKWYFETTSGKNSYEAKLKWGNHLHSVEFNEKGIIEDIEVKIEWHEMSDDVQQNIHQYFNDNYTHYKIRKIQRQWTGSPDDLEDAIDEAETDEVETQYEIEFHGRTEERNELWEGLFDGAGQLIQKRAIQLRAADNLSF